MTAPLIDRTAASWWAMRRARALKLHGTTAAVFRVALVPRMDLEGRVDLTAADAAGLAGCSLRGARRALRDLVDRGALDKVAPGRWQVRGLPRARFVVSPARAARLPRVTIHDAPDYALVGFTWATDATRAVMATVARRGAARWADGRWLVTRASADLLAEFFARHGHPVERADLGDTPTPWRAP